MKVELGLSSDTESDSDEFISTGPAFKLHLFLTTVLHRDEVDKYNASIPLVSQCPELAEDIFTLCKNHLESLTQISVETKHILY